MEELNAWPGKTEEAAANHIKTWLDLTDLELEEIRRLSCLYDDCLIDDDEASIKNALERKKKEYPRIGYSFAVYMLAVQAEGHADPNMLWNETVVAVSEFFKKTKGR